MTAALLAVALLALPSCSVSGSTASPEHPDSRGSGGRTAAAREPATPYWVNRRSTAAREAAKLRREGRAADAELIGRIADQPMAEWIGSDDPEGQARGFTRAAAEADRSALLVLYNLPHRDCGQYSSGGAADGAAYRAWLDGVAAGIGGRRATVVVEPDALPHLLQEGCTPAEFHEERYALLRDAIGKLTALPRTTVYLDAGNPQWVREPGGLVEPLRRAGVENADGFALNVSNFVTTAGNIAYGKQLSAMSGGKHFVIDTSRNGNGPAAEGGEESWCNPPGRALGEAPTTRTGEPLVDAFLWIKRPGESDGPCRGGPGAGQWWTEYALELARNA